MTDQPASLWLIVRRGPEGTEEYEPAELHPTQDLALAQARALRAEREQAGAWRPGDAFYVVEVPVIWPLG